MHIHPGSMPTHTSLNGAEATLAARRAEETRKKLLNAASALDQGTTAEGAWMVGAWAGQNNNPGSQSSPGSAGSGDSLDPAAINGVSRASAPAAVTSNSSSSSSVSPNSHSSSPLASDPVSYWA